MDWQKSRTKIKYCTKIPRTVRYIDNSVQINIKFTFIAQEYIPCY